MTTSAERMRKCFAKNPEKYRIKNREQYDKFREDRITRSVEYRRKLRQTLIQLLDGKCIRCGESDWRCLQVDHVNGGGSKKAKMRRNYTKYFKGIMDEVKAGSKEYQLLCANCNWKKFYENKEYNRHRGE